MLLYVITRKCYSTTLWGGGWASSNCGYMHMNRLIKLHAEIMSWIASVYECCLCMTLTWSGLNRTMYNLYSLRAACRWWSICSCCDKHKVKCRACLNLSHLHYSCHWCTLAVSQDCSSLFKKYLNAHSKFTVHGHKLTSMLQTHFCNAVPLVWGSLRIVPNYLVICSLPNCLAMVVYVVLGWENLINKAPPLSSNHSLV